jgi:hypothetical protein
VILLLVVLVAVVMVPILLMLTLVAKMLGMSNAMLLAIISVGDCP